MRFVDVCPKELKIGSWIASDDIQCFSNQLIKTPLKIRPRVYMVQLETNTSVIYHLYVRNNETVKPVNWSYTILQVTPDLDVYINQIGFDGQLMITPLFRQYRKPGRLMLQVWIKSAYKEGFIETVQNVHFRVLGMYVVVVTR
ncbi:unnamed protein product [Trichobilharzia regenti]|nr:unnamed protein product [Trichobilharzia regenti]